MTEHAMCGTIDILGGPRKDPAMADGPETEDRLAGGELNASVARAVLHKHREFVGRGPRKATVFFQHNILVVVMEDPFTTAERSLIDSGRHDAALRIRDELHDGMRIGLVDAVQQLSGSTVTAFLSSSNVDPDLTAQVFVLDRPVSGRVSNSLD